jgi:cell division septum initiation protein DivIVA
MATAPRQPGSVDPDDLGRREFSKSRKGWDPVEVRAHLLSMADEIKRLQGVEFELETRVAGLDEELAKAREFDESHMTQVLGEETARVLEAARTAAVDIRSRAEESSARLIREAQEQATATLRDAEEVRLAAAREADELVAEARSRVDELMRDARRDADQLRETAQSDATTTRERADQLLAEKTAEASAEAERIRGLADIARASADEYSDRTRSEADEHAATVRGDAERHSVEVRTRADEAAERTRSEAEVAAERRAEESAAASTAELDRSREEGRRMVQEARDARERMLRDLAERRRTARQQLEALRAGRERLLEAFTSARAAFDDATDELTDALPAAREAADRAARDIDGDIESEVRALDAEIGGEPGAPEERDTTPETVVEIVEIEVEELIVETVDLGDVQADDAGPAGTVDEEDDDAGAHLRLVPPARHASFVHGVEDDDSEEDEDDIDDIEEEDDEESAGGGSVEAIFARLRATNSEPSDEVSEEPDRTVTGAVVIDLGSERLADTERGSNEEAAADSASDIDDVAADDDVEEIEATASLLDQRDEVLATIERAVGRRLKRALSDQENAVLDRLQRDRRQKVAADLLDDAQQSADALWTAVCGDLAEAVTAGSTFFGDDQHGRPVAPDTVAASLRPSFDEWVSAALRERLEHTIEGTDDKSEAPDRLRSTYREWKNDKVNDLSGDLVTLAFNQGILSSATETATHCWIVDNGGLPCPDAEDNHLAGAVVAGDEFPTGHRLPPAHPGCRCLLGPVDQ